jgi:hypothetical protein
MAAEDPRHLFVTGILAEAKFSEVLSAFEPFGRIQSLTFLSPKESTDLGRAFLNFHDPDSGARCLAQSRQSATLVSEKVLPGDAVAVAVRGSASPSGSGRRARNCWPMSSRRTSATYT